MDIFKTPGGSLLGGDKSQFGKHAINCVHLNSLNINFVIFNNLDELKVLVDKATNDFLIKADWEANMACVDKINGLVGPNV